MIELTVMSPAPANDTQTFESDDNLFWANGTQVSGEVTVMMDSTSDGDHTDGETYVTLIQTEEGVRLGHIETEFCEWLADLLQLELSDEPREIHETFEESVKSSAPVDKPTVMEAPDGLLPE